MVCAFLSGSWQGPLIFQDDLFGPASRFVSVGH